MPWSFLIAFAIAIILYVVISLVIAFVKRYRNKKNKASDSDEKQE